VPHITPIQPHLAAHDADDTYALQATHGKRMTLMDYFMLALAVFFMIGAFTATEMRGALSYGHGPGVPISLTGRIILFLVGVVIVLHVFHLV
jgi:hypothetical protein